MTSEQFCYWLQGFIEITDAKNISEKEMQIIKDHLQTVFEKVTPDRHAPLREWQEGLDRLRKDYSQPSDSSSPAIC